MIRWKRLAVVFFLIVGSACLFGYLCDLTIASLTARVIIEVFYAAVIGIGSVHLTQPWWLKSRY